MTTIRWSSLTASLIFLAGAAFAQAPSAEPVAIEIPALPLNDALKQLARQAGFQVVFYSKESEGLSARGLSGKFTAAQALDEMLAGTGLTYEFVNRNTVAIRAKAEKSVTSLESSSRPPMKIAALNEGERPGDGSESEGVSTTTALIESLPQNFALASQSGSGVPGVSNSAVQGSAVNLRGIGEGTTLVLLNGRRMPLGFLGGAVDISALPLSAIERVEVLTDGASALYGSDAVGGVVNFVLRRDFDGAETRLRGGWADGGINEYRVSQALGDVWDSGNAVFSLEYYKRDLLSATERDFVPEESDVGSLLPRDRNYSAMFSGRQSLTKTLSVFVDALYSRRKSFNEGGSVTFGQTFTINNPQLMANIGVEWRLGGDWQLDTATGYAENELELRNTFFGLHGRLDSPFRISTVTAKTDGSLLKLPGGRARLALGVDWRKESFRDSSEFGGVGVISRDTDQTVRSIFTELYVPIVGATNRMAGIARLELSLAGRFDDYSSFGSSFDPRFGLMWEPIAGLRARASYGTSYLAPRLLDLSTNANSATAFTAPDPRAVSGFSRQLQVFGTDVASLDAQESESSSFGIELQPESIPRFKLALSYYQIKYTARIVDPSIFPVLANESSFSSLIIREPSVDQVNEFISTGNAGLGLRDCDIGCIPNPAFDPAAVAVILDLRRRNLSATRTSGLDVSVDYRFASPIGSIQVGITGTHIFELEQQITASSGRFETVDTFNNPPNWRFRGFLDWQRLGWSASFFVNHTDSYTDNRALATIPIASYTTVDARLAYDLSSKIDRGILSGTTLALSAQNLLDRDPPHTAVLVDFADMGFDPTNANPMGRLIAVELSKAW